MKKILMLVISSCLLFGCAGIPIDDQAPVNPDFTWMNKDNEGSTIIVVPPSEIRALREMVIENKYRLDKVETIAINAQSTANTALENQGIFNNLLQALSNKIEDYRMACQAMFDKMLKK